jgi:hypothetical protein
LGKVAALAITAEPKGKKMKVLTHRPCYIEQAVIPEFGKGISLAAKAKENVPIMQSTEEAIVMPKVSIAEPVKDKADKVEESKAKKIMQFPKKIEPSDRGNTAEGTKGFYCNSQEEKDGECAGCCAGNDKSLDSCSYKESCQSCQSATRN